MPKIPTLDSNQVRPLGGMPNVQRSEVPNNGLQQVGNALSNVADVRFRIQQEEKAKASQAEFMETDGKAGVLENSLLTDPVNGAFARQGKDAIGLTPKVLEDFDKEISKLDSGLHNERAKFAFREATTKRRQEIERMLNRHEGEQTRRYYEAERQSYVDQAHSTAVTYYRDPVRVDQEIEKQRAAIEQTPGISAEMKAAQLAASRSQTYSGVIDRYLANIEIDGAEKYYASVKDKINGEQATRIESTIRIAKDRRDAEKKANLTELRQSLNDQIRDIDVAAQMGMPITNLPSKAVLVAAFGAHEGEQRFQQTQMATRLSADVSGLQQKSSAELMQLVQSYKPTQVEGAADQIQRAGFISRATDAILKQRAEDPAGYLATSAPKTQGAWQRFMQTGDDADREAYISAVTADKARLGIDSPDILPNGYADTLASHISNPKSAEQLATIMEAATSPRFE